jgi:hypothetical protein
MKAVVFAFAFLIATIACSQKPVSPSQLTFIEPPDTTELGTPDGNPVSKDIGPAGGTIVSDDGTVQLIFPQGALSKNTTITIQPTTNPAPNGSGKAYWFQPSGTQFSKPVKIVHHYTQEEAEECPPELMALASQDRAGKWTYFDYKNWDSTTNTLHGFIDHFSGSAKVKKYSIVLTDPKKLGLDPSKKLVAARDELGILVVDITKKVKPRNEYAIAVLNQTTVIQWYVNDELNGNRTVGEIKNEEFNLGAEKSVLAKFFAPDYIPLTNPVTIAAAVNVYNPKTKEHDAKRYLTCKITIYDQYKIILKHKFDARVGMGNEVTDEANFIASVYRDKKHGNTVVLDSINNAAPVFIKKGGKNLCELEITINQSTPGSIHVTTAGLVKKTVSPDEKPRIMLGWKPSDITAFRFRWLCPGARAVQNTPMVIEGLPTLINFVADGQPHFDNVPSAPMGGEYTIDIKPLRPRSN